MTALEPAASAIEPFRIEVPDAELDDLRRRLRATRWPDRETVDDWTQGVPLSYVQEVCAHWADGYDWRRIESRLNQIPQHKTAIDGVGIHFLGIGTSFSRHRGYEAGEPGIPSPGGSDRG